MAIKRYMIDNLPVGGGTANRRWDYQWEADYQREVGLPVGDGTTSGRWDNQSKEGLPVGGGTNSGKWDNQ